MAVDGELSQMKTLLTGVLFSVRPLFWAVSSLPGGVVHVWKLNWHKHTLSHMNVYMQMYNKMEYDKLPN